MKLDALVNGDLKILSVEEQSKIKGGLLLITCEEKRSMLTGKSYMVPVLKLNFGGPLLAVRM